MIQNYNNNIKIAFKNNFTQYDFLWAETVTFTFMKFSYISKRRKNDKFNEKIKTI